MTDMDGVIDRARVAAGISTAAGAAAREAWLTQLAASLDAAAPELVTLADEETHLGEPRLTGELARTTAQLRALGSAVAEGSYLEATIDHPDPAATPPIPDLRRMLVPLDVVAVYSASNFPFAFSVFGGDTAAALAVGSAVVVKAHPGHERLSMRITQIGRAALEDAGAPTDIVQLVSGFDAGIALVRHPGVDAAAFTGSVRGGRALFDEVAARARPIPFYGELGSINPVVITDAAVRARGDELAEGLAASFTVGRGQFCTKPGLVFAPADAGFAERVAAAVPAGGGEGVLLTASIADGFADGARRLASHAAVETVREGAATAEGARPDVFATTVAALVADPGVLGEECFGPSTLIVGYDDRAELLAGLDIIEGSLTGTLHAEPDEPVADLVDSLVRRSGRVLFGGWPTGVAVSWAQTHGGPYPATTSLYTSVGQTSLRRFLRPVSYQTAPAALLPPELRDDNPRGIPRRIDGRLRSV